ncbi:MAG: amino acid deaminase/aldolase [Microbacteriaceae bacterium]
MLLTRPTSQPWRTPATYWPSFSAATAELDPPYGVLSVEALAHNALDMLDRANGTPIRVASKSVRVRSVLDAALALPGYAGVLAYTLPEALWLASDVDGYAAIPDVVVGYPTADRGALRELGRDAELASRVTIMIDSIAQLDLVDAAISPAARASIRVCIELDASWDTWYLGHTGVRRSPVHTVAQARALAEAVVSRPGFTLVGLMGYEAQIAGQANNPAGRRAYGAIVRWMQRHSGAELADRRGAAVASIREIAELEFVNGGGTGSLESTSADASVTEIAAGSGLFGPHLFDNYTHFSPAPAAAFALSVVRKPLPGTAVLLGGGWVASGPPGADRLPRVVWPENTKMLPREMAGEVQTPLEGAGAAALEPGDRVWLRHTKAGEISEHLNEFAVVENGVVTEMVPTYRGQGKVFL